MSKSRMAGYPSRVVVYDTETVPTYPYGPSGPQYLQLRLGVAITRDGAAETTPWSAPFRFTTPTQFHTFITSMPRDFKSIYIFAHNHGFDVRTIDLFGRIGSGYYSLEPPHLVGTPEGRDKILCVVESPPMIVKTYDARGQSYIWCDTYQWISQSLAKIGEDLGFEKGRMPPLEAALEEWWPYCERDVKVLAFALDHVFNWLKDNKVAKWLPTRAGQALWIFENMFGINKVDRYQTDESITLARQGYIGGYTQCLRQGRTKGPIHQIDVNSLYPYVMRENIFPVKLTHEHNAKKIHDPSILKNPEASIAEVWIQSRDHEYPYKCRDGTYWCSGRVHTVLCGPELTTALERGDVVGVGSFSIYEMSRIFTDFIDTYNTQKIEAEREGRAMDRLIIKLMMNSLYGKYGQKEYKWHYLGDNNDPSEYKRGQIVDPDGRYGGEVMIVGGKVFISRTIGEAPCSFVPIAAFTTAYARNYMEGIRLSLPKGHVYYQATDSLHVSERAWKEILARKLIHPTRLGAFKHEGEFKYVDYKNVHCYDTNTKTVRGSVRRGSSPLGGERYQTARWESLRTAINHGHTDTVVIEPFVKHLSAFVTRRKIQWNGQCIPIEIDSWDRSLDTLSHESFKPTSIHRP